MWAVKKPLMFFFYQPFCYHTYWPISKLHPSLIIRSPFWLASVKYWDLIGLLVRKVVGFFFPPRVTKLSKRSFTLNCLTLNPCLPHRLLSLVWIKVTELNSWHMSTPLPVPVPPSPSCPFLFCSICFSLSASSVSSGLCLSLGLFVLTSHSRLLSLRHTHTQDVMLCVSVSGVLKWWWFPSEEFWPLGWSLGGVGSRKLL